ncbi:MAG: MraY family glycosyltransferase [Bacteroidota bacterium]
MTIHLLVCILFAFVLSYLMIPLLIKYAIKYALLDQPNRRKLHINPTPSLGGLAIFAAFISVFFLSPSTEISVKTQALALVATLIVLVGLYDDLYDMRAGKKALWQIALISVLYLAGIRLEGLAGLPFFEQFPPVLSYFATVLFVMTIINAYNLIDGIDGLAGSLSLHACLVFAWLFYALNNVGWSVMALSVSAGLLAFLKYNFRNARIFLGDNGSMLLGLMIAVFSLEYLQCCGNQTANTSNVLIVLSIVIIPVMDQTRIFFTRINRGHSPFRADRTHIHHILLDNHLKTTSICLSLVFLNMLLVYSTNWLEQIYLPLALFELLLSAAIGMLLICIGSFYLRSRKKRKRMDRQSIIDSFKKSL